MQTKTDADVLVGHGCSVCIAGYCLVKQTLVGVFIVAIEVGWRSGAGAGIVYYIIDCIDRVVITWVSLNKATTIVLISRRVEITGLRVGAADILRSP